MMRSFISNRSGNLALTFALAAVPVLGAAGFAVTYAGALLEKSQLQQALDAAVLAGTSLGHSVSEEQRLAVAYSLAANAQPSLGRDPKLEITSENVAVDFTTIKDTVHGVATIKVENIFAGFIGSEALSVRVMANAEKRQSEPICLHALNETGETGLEVFGHATLDADCVAMANSGSDEAIKVYGAKSSAIAKRFGLTGSYSGSVSPKPETDIEPVKDLYATLPIPRPGLCIELGDRLKKGTFDIEPGTYCGGLSVSPGATVRMRPGIYVMKDGPLQIGAGSVVSGEEVIIAFVGTDSVLDVNANSQITLTSPKSGTYKNVQMVSDRELMGSSKGEEATISSSVMDFDGLIYLPEQDMWIKGDSRVTGRAPSMIMVADQYRIQDGATVTVRQKDEREIGVGDVSRFNFSARLVL